MKTFFKVKNLIYSIILIPFLFTAVPFQNSLAKTSNSDSSTSAEVLKKEKPTIPKGYSIEQVSMGNKHSAAVVTDGTSDQLYTWGNNNQSQLGLGEEKTADYYTTPQKVSFPDAIDEETIQIEQISMGGHHSAAVLNTDAGDQLYTWGGNNYGQLGNGSYGGNNKANVPTRIILNDSIENPDIKQISLGENSSAAIVSDENDDYLYTWGRNNSGQLGLGDEFAEISYITTPTQVTSLPKGNIEEIAMSMSFGAAIINNNETDKLYTWGDNILISNDSPDKIEYGKLGLGENKIEKSYNTPQEVETLSSLGEINNFSQISLGEKHSSVVVNNNELYTWGLNDKGQLGDGTNKNINIPQKINGFPANGANIQQTSLGWKSSATIVDEKLYTWGDNEDGELGTGLTDGTLTSSEPELVSFNLKNTNVKQISMGATSSIAIVNDGKHDYLYTWGQNDKGQLGLGNTTTYYAPQQVDLSILVNLSFIDHWYFYFVVVVVPIIVIGLLTGLLIYFKKRNAVK